MFTHTIKKKCLHTHNNTLQKSHFYSDLFETNFITLLYIIKQHSVLINTPSQHVFRTLCECLSIKPLCLCHILHLGLHWPVNKQTNKHKKVFLYQNKSSAETHTLHCSLQKNWNALKSSNILIKITFCVFFFWWGLWIFTAAYTTPGSPVCADCSTQLVI